MRIARITLGLGVSCLLVLQLGTTACKQAEDDDDAAEEEAADGAPATPSPYTMSLDIDMNEEAASEAMTFDAQTPQFATTAGVNAGLAAFVIAGVTFNIGAQMAVPVALLTQALEHDAVAVSDTVWLWSFDFEDQNVKWTANLTGTRLNDDSNSWSMSVTRDPVKVDGCCTNFVLFSGVTDADGTAGNWQVFDASRSDEPEELYQLIFDYTSEDERTLTYTVNSDKPESERFGRGSIVTYAVTPATFSLVVDDSAEDGQHTIVVDREDKSGSYVQASGAEYCWDTLANDQVNIDCP